MAVTITLERFQGPLDLLLELIYAEKLEVNEISLKEVTDQFIRYLDTAHIPAHELTDFLSVAVKLVLLKTRSLLPYLEAEEENEEDLEHQLKMYEIYWKAAKQIQAMIRGERRLFGKPKNPRLTDVIFSPPTKKNITIQDLEKYYNDVLSRIEPLNSIPKTSIKKAVSLTQKITLLRTILLKSGRVSFRSFVTENGTSKTDIIVNFLAALELIKQNEINVESTSSEITLIHVKV